MKASLILEAWKALAEGAEDNELVFPVVARPLSSYYDLLQRNKYIKSLAPPLFPIVCLSYVIFQIRWLSDTGQWTRAELPCYSQFLGKWNLSRVSADVVDLDE
jgi:hypothetical protein